MGMYMGTEVDLHRRLGRSFRVPACVFAIGAADSGELVCGVDAPPDEDDDFVAVDPGFDPSRSPRPRLWKLSLSMRFLIKRWTWSVNPHLPRLSRAA